jgi:Tfp pilus assembly protein PilE
MSVTKAETSATPIYAKFSLIELLTILLLVGLIFVFVVPVNQAKINRDRVNEAISTMKLIGDKAEEFKNNPDNGYYPDLSQLNLDAKTKSAFFDYTIVADDSTIVAETTPSFGKKGAFLIYSLSGKQYRIGKGDTDTESKKYLNENWLP